MFVGSSMFFYDVRDQEKMRKMAEIKILLQTFQGFIIMYMNSVDFGRWEIVFKKERSSVFEL